MFRELEEPRSDSTKAVFKPGQASKMSSVPRLTDVCRTVLRTNVAQLVDVGEVPYEMIRDVLFGCRVDQLREIEALSPHIADEDEGE